MTLKEFKKRYVQVEFDDEECLAISASMCMASIITQHPECIEKLPPVEAMLCAKTAMELLQHSEAATNVGQKFLKAFSGVQTVENL